ncbi:16S rRNA (guanine(966)-N(2))-methyltransferase RsmD [Limnobacter sp.]|uniref:16S rRNA (guanine(966)-N(2))-methyltransferase RsmD n=1 Tax=Limnobacter sp. TaxID=2003368 RepID=UPI0035178039
MSKPGSLRIIGGVWRRHLLPIAPVEGLRPTPDRVRETLFNWLGQDCTGMSVLDLFAGTGALGFEAASRGASPVVLVESHRAVAAQIKLNMLKLLPKWQLDGPAPDLLLDNGDVLVALRRLSNTGQRFDLVALDPPFNSDWLAKTLPLVPQVLKPGGLVYVEWHADLFKNPSELAGLLGGTQIDTLRHLKAGQVHAHLFALPAL